MASVCPVYKLRNKCQEYKYSFITYFSTGGGGISIPDGLLGGVFSFSIIANGASGGGKGLTVFVSILNLILMLSFNETFYHKIFNDLLLNCNFCLVFC